MRESPKIILSRYSKEELREILLKEMEMVGLSFSDDPRDKYQPLRFPEYFDWEDFDDDC